MFLVVRFDRRIFAAQALVLACLFLRSADAGTTAETAPDFARDVAPILTKSCAPCHNASLMQAQFRVDSEAYLLKGGLHGAAIIPGRSVDSLLVKRILGADDEPRMPLGSPPLSTEQIATIRAWIDKGSVDATKVDMNTSKASEKGASSPVFAERIRPLLASRCYGCHGPDIHQNGLRLDSLAGTSQRK